MNESRELTRDERSAIRKLVVTECANHDKEYGCLILGAACYMQNKCWTGSYCKYFRNAVLPLDPVLQAALTGGSLEQRPCAVCGKGFPVSGKKVYCSDYCAGKAHRRNKREYMRKKRGRV